MPKIMRYIAHEMSDASKETGEPLTSQGILEVYNLEQHLLAEETGIPGDIKLLTAYLSIVETALGDQTPTPGNRSELVSLLKVVHYLKATAL
jgi:hypothetical protein